MAATVTTRDLVKGQSPALLGQVLSGGHSMCKVGIRTKGHLVFMGVSPLSDGHGDSPLVLGGPSVSLSTLLLCGTCMWPRRQGQV